MINICLIVSYSGHNFKGFQKQQNLNTIQEELEKAISKIANQNIDIVCAGRTDANVHATAQVINFKTTANRELISWIEGTNSFLPKSIRVLDAFIVDQDFHARFSATARRYFYIIENTPIASPHIQSYTTHEKYKNKLLNESLMNKAAQLLVGEHDFSSFRASNCQSKTPFRNIMNIRVFRKGFFVIIDIKANAFLYHMVRNIVGTLLEIGREKQDIIYAQKILNLKDRTKAPAMAKPNGLYLIEVDYPIEFIKAKIIGPTFIN